MMIVLNYVHKLIQARFFQFHIFESKLSKRPFFSKNQMRGEGIHVGNFLRDGITFVLKLSVDTCNIE